MYSREVCKARINTTAYLEAILSELGADPNPSLPSALEQLVLAYEDTESDVRDSHYDREPKCNVGINVDAPGTRLENCRLTYIVMCCCALDSPYLGT